MEVAIKSIDKRHLRFRHEDAAREIKVRTRCARCFQTRRGCSQVQEAQYHRPGTLLAARTRHRVPPLVKSRHV